MRFSSGAGTTQLRHHNKYQKHWEESYCNELGGLCQGIGTGNKVIKKQRVAGTEMFQVVRYEDVPSDRRNEVTYTKISIQGTPPERRPQQDSNHHCWQHNHLPRGCGNPHSFP